MAVTAVYPSTFTLFSGLPQELRDQIWRDALPDNVGPALFFYKKGCWCPGQLSESDKFYDPENEEQMLNFEFRHDLLDDAQFEIPLVFVNRESRAIALAWIREQGIEVRSGKNGQNPAFFVRAYDPTQDALYVSPDKWSNFLWEADDRRSEPDLCERDVNIAPDLARIAVPEALFQDALSQTDVATLSEIFKYYFSLEVLLVVVDAQPDLRAVENGGNLQRR